MFLLPWLCTSRLRGTGDGTDTADAEKGPGERSTGAAERADAGTSRNGIAGHLAPVSFGTGDEGYGSCRSRFSQGKAAAGETGILAEAVREEVIN